MAREWELTGGDIEAAIKKEVDAQATFGYEPGEVDKGFSIARAAQAKLVRWLVKYSAVERLAIRDGGIVLRTILESVLQELCRELEVASHTLPQVFCPKCGKLYACTALSMICPMCHTWIKRGIPTEGTEIEVGEGVSDG